MTLDRLSPSDHDDGPDDAGPAPTRFAEIAFGVNIGAAVVVVACVAYSGLDRPAPLRTVVLLAVAAFFAGLASLRSRRGWPWLIATAAWVLITVVLAPLVSTAIRPGSCFDGLCFQNDVSVINSAIATAVVVSALAVVGSAVAACMPTRASSPPS